MTTIFYKIILGRYLIDKIAENAGMGVTLKLEEPIDAPLTIGENIHRFEKGVCRIDKLAEGEISPKLYTGARLNELEGFVYKNGAAHLKRDPNRFMADTLTALGVIEKRLYALETLSAELSEKISRKISFSGYSKNEIKDTEKRK